MNLQDPAKQVEFARLVGVSQPNISKLAEKGVLPVGGTYVQWLHAYCERLREEAAGRMQSDARERRDLAQAMESEANAQLKMRELYKQDGLLISRDDARRTLTEWSVLAKHEMAKTVQKLIDAIEAQHGITIDDELPSGLLDAAYRSVANHSIEYGDDHEADPAGCLDPAA